MTGEQSLLLWTDAMKAIREGKLDEAERLADQMEVKSDALLVRTKIKLARERCT